ncbi:MAG TPA: amidase family protein, partial [Ramlibacter sp.]|nr:amidase family protein [Ramlibacter sp.]
FALLGTGSDTGQSIRSPASACCLVGVRPTRGLVSRAGVMPNCFTQDEAGPITRTVEDAARMLDVLVGFDPRDPVSALGVGKAPPSYLAALGDAPLRGARIGLLEDLLGHEARHVEVNQVMEQVVDTLQQQGTTVLRLAVPGLQALLGRVSTDRWEARIAFDQYLHALGPGQPVASFEQLVQGRSALPDVQHILEAELAIADGLHDPEYLQRLANRDRLRVLLAAQLAQHGLDALLYPQQRVLVAPLGQPDQPERNGALSHGTGFPAVTFPGGFSPATPDAPLGVPVGAELLGPDFSEAKLLGYAQAFERIAHVRRPPKLESDPN